MNPKTVAICILGLLIGMAISALLRIANDVKHMRKSLENIEAAHSSENGSGDHVVLSD